MESGTTRGLEETIQEIGAAVIGRLGQIIDRAEKIVMAEDPHGYGAVPNDEIKMLSREGIGVLLHIALVENRAPAASDQEWLRQAIEARANLGLAGDSILASLPVTLQEIWIECTAVADEIKADPGVLPPLASTLMLWWGVVARTVAIVFREREIEAARADERGRAELLRTILAGSFKPTAGSIGLAAHGLAPDAAYHAFRARTPAASRRDLERSLSESARETGGMVGIIGEDIVGLLGKQPRIHDADAVVALGPPAVLSDVHRSFEAASRTLEIAEALGKKGLVRSEELGVIEALPVAAEVGRKMVAKYLEPLDREGAFGGATEESLRALLAHDMNVEAAAKAIVVHPNTLRYRVKRFEELTGASLSSVGDLVEIWWALRQRELDTSRVGRPLPAD